MKLGKVITLFFMGALSYQHLDLVAEQAQFLYNIIPIAQTYMEMSSFKNRLELYLFETEGYFPPNFQQWLREEFRSSLKEDVSVDFFGNPYVAGYENGTPLIRSCGPDGECYTKDDLVVKLAYR